MSLAKQTNYHCLLVRVDRQQQRHTLHPRHIFPPLDLFHIRAQIELETPQSTTLIDGWQQPFQLDQITLRCLKSSASIAIIHAVSWSLEESIALATALRQAGIITIAVGQQVEHHARVPIEGWQQAYTIALAGEPEQEAATIINRLRHGEAVEAIQSEYHTKRIKNYSAQIEDPSLLASPYFSSEDLLRYPFPFPVSARPLRQWGYLQTNWGCPRPCRHCSQIVRKSTGRLLRERPIEQVLDQIAHFKDLGADAVAFEDDSLFVNRRRLLELTKEMIQRNLVLPWMANARPDELDDEVIAACKASGAVLLKIGVDSGAPTVIERLGKSNEGKRWMEQSRAAFAGLRRNHISSVAMFMVGMPSETVDETTETQALIKQLQPDYLQVQIYRPYPDVPLWDELAEGLRVQSSEYHYQQPETNCSQIPLKDLISLQKGIYRRFYLHPQTIIRHLRRFWRHYLGRQTPLAQPLRYLFQGR